MQVLLKTLSDTFEPIRLAAIKGLEALIEYLGCTLGSLLPQIVENILLSYSEFKKQNKNSKLVIDMYHHLLETFLNVLASCSSQILRVIFTGIMGQNMFKKGENNVELLIKIFLMKQLTQLTNLILMQSFMSIFYGKL
ncbi:hypothetical protein IMG5_098700 [Ichthyophthirius multifiliis]|uniref:Uncharacterized protein n=1 Tax=Ichthyophthirius multifiliis TaxID=5932 RepID=G0QS04_ICHMU|nr:hypothetical protein IMG5_098700 [Ichthyophthirius multifiliis]EGR32034.1 hypothetical protein IMG5_098700 [Ichthyophthirius multifiliis]|eukprot:XP_004035520.1 hypothetical protein IMG5_098700 [Ichthyophthirius multifiliis]